MLTDFLLFLSIKNANFVVYEIFINWPNCTFLLIAAEK